MANRRFTQNMQTLERTMVKLYADVVTDAGGLITSSTNKGVVITRTAQGLYTLTFSHTVGTAIVPDLYPGLKMIQMVEDVGEVARVAIVANNISTTGIVTVNLLDFAGASVDADSANEFWEITLKNTGVAL